MFGLIADAEWVCPAGTSEDQTEEPTLQHAVPAPDEEVRCQPKSGPMYAPETFEAFAELDPSIPCKGIDRNSRGQITSIKLTGITPLHLQRAFADRLPLLDLRDVLAVAGAPD